MEAKEKKTRKRKPPVGKTDTLPDGTVIDIDSFDWGEFADLKPKQKALVVWYTLPNQKGFMDFTNAARKAGYTAHSAYCMKYKVMQNEKVCNCIKMFEDRIVKTSVAEAYKNVMQMKIQRATYSVRDFYESREIENKETGDKYNRLLAKSIDDIPEDKVCLIDNVDINQSGIATFKLPNREKEINDIIKLNAELNQEKSTGDYDVETTVETIRDRLHTVKTTVRITNEKIRENAGNYIENSEELPEFD